MVRDTAEDLMLMEAGYQLGDLRAMSMAERAVVLGVVAERNRLRREAQENQQREMAFRAKQGG